jgi:two-component sensor histidine kinase
VAAQAGQADEGSAYREKVVGQWVLPQREPAVFHAIRLMAPVRDLKAITQEDRVVRQNAVPIRGEGGRCIGVLIRERDISRDLLQEKKFQSLARSYEQEDLSLRSPQPLRDDAALREIHHRVKNNLQLVASILNLQARRAPDPACRRLLGENVGRVLSIAAIHDILTQNKACSTRVESRDLLERLRANLLPFIPESQQIGISVTGDSVSLSPDTASAVALVVNELITNALEHAFEGRPEGQITVSLCAGELYHTVTVSDDGAGFDPGGVAKGSFGLRIVQATVQDRLHGRLTIRSDGAGSQVSFDFKNE